MTNGIYENTQQFVSKHKAGVIAASAALALGTTAAVLAKRRKKRNNIKPKNRKRLYKHKKGERYTPHTAGKRKDTSHRRIRHTKTGQPYIILASGKARFISKKSARTSRKRTGGRY